MHHSVTFLYLLYLTFNKSSCFKIEPTYIFRRPHLELRAIGCTIVRFPIRIESLCGKVVCDPIGMLNCLKLKCTSFLEGIIKADQSVGFGVVSAGRGITLKQEIILCDEK